VIMASGPVMSAGDAADSGADQKAGSCPQHAYEAKYGPTAAASSPDISYDAFEVLKRVVPAGIEDGKARARPNSATRSGRRS